MYSSLSLVLFLPITLSVSLAISLSVSSWYVSLSPTCPCLIPVCLSRSLCVSPGSVSLSVSLSHSRSVSPFLPSLLLSHPVLSVCLYLSLFLIPFCISPYTVLSRLVCEISCLYPCPYFSFSPSTSNISWRFSFLPHFHKTLLFFCFFFHLLSLPLFLSTFLPISFLHFSFSVRAQEPAVQCNAHLTHGAL